MHCTRPFVSGNFSTRCIFPVISIRNGYGPNFSKVVFRTEIHVECIFHQPSRVDENTDGYSSIEALLRFIVGYSNMTCSC